jgi:hypothetical protein
MGGLLEDITAFYNAANDIGGNPEKSNAQIARHWLEASARHGIPMRTEGFRLVRHFSDGSAEKAFREDLEMTRRYAVRGLPTFLLRCLDKELLLRGYQDFRAMQAVIDTLTTGGQNNIPTMPMVPDCWAFSY